MLLALACLFTTQAGGTEDVSADAEVTFMRAEASRGAGPLGTGPVAVFVDNDFHGELPRDSYLETSVPPGPHLVSGGWIRFSAGSKYCFVWTGSGWLLHSPHADIEVHQSESATRIPRAEAAVARPRVEAHRKKHEKALRKAGEPPTAGLAATFDNVFHSKKLLGMKNLFRMKTKGGRLSVDLETVRFESQKKSLEIPVGTLMGVSFAGYTPNDPEPWLGLFHGTEDDFEIEYFSPRGDYNSVFVALQEAMDEAANDESGSDATGG